MDDHIQSIEDSVLTKKAGPSDGETELRPLNIQIVPTISDKSSPYFASDSPRQNIPTNTHQQNKEKHQKLPNLTALSAHRKRRFEQQPSTPSAASVPSITDAIDLPLWQRLDRLEQRLNAALAALSFPQRIAAIYNPTVYARSLHCTYLKRFLANREPTILFVGMNPGPWGMCQTGVPFGSVPMVRDWMRLNGDVDARPTGELTAAYPVRGMQCERVEVSGKRFWTLMRRVFCEYDADERMNKISADDDNVERFFGHCFVHNLCPLAMFEARGRNITPADLKLDECRPELERMCTDALQEFIGWCGPNVRLVSIGGYVDRVVRAAYRCRGAGKVRPAEMLCMPHPSPRAVNNTNWEEKAGEWLKVHGIGPMKLVVEA